MFFGDLHVSTDNSTFPFKIFSNFGYGELRCVLSVNKSTLMFREIWLRAYSARWSIEGENTGRHGVNLSIFTCVLESSAV